MHRYFVSGTDTDVGKTLVTAALALALREAGHDPTVIKLVQTGVAPHEAGDAEKAGSIAGCRYLEFARFARAADPWSAALADNVEPLHKDELVGRLDRIVGAIVVEGAGGLAVPIDDASNFGDVAVGANLQTVVAVGLRLGCLNHALLTLALCKHMHLNVAGAVLVERFGGTSDAYRADVVRTLQDKVHLFGILPFEQNEALAAETGALLFKSLAE